MHQIHGHFIPPIVCDFPRQLVMFYVDSLAPVLYLFEHFCLVTLVCGVGVCDLIRMGSKERRKIVLL